MKLNKILMLASIVAAGLSSGIPAQAQDSNAPAATPPPMRRPQIMNAEGLTKALDLTDDQKTKVKPILEDMQKQGADIRKDTSLAPEDRRAKMKEIRDAAGAKLKEILTPEQYAKWEKMAQGRRPAGGAPAAAPATTPDAPKN
ncbi:MAG TPA: hypothetical protein VG347_02930 [Verrucomicrobiae bacterium]|nr:hypothetical protein [Verrucomicrobiae bacterium]